MFRAMQYSFNVLNHLVFIKMYRMFHNSGPYYIRVYNNITIIKWWPGKLIFILPFESCYFLNNHGFKSCLLIITNALNLRWRKNSLLQISKSVITFLLSIDFAICKKYYKNIYKIKPCGMRLKQQYAKSTHQHLKDWFLCR